MMLMQKVKMPDHGCILSQQTNNFQVSHSQKGFGIEINNSSQYCIIWTKI